MVILKVFRITLINAPPGNKVKTCTSMAITTTNIAFLDKNEAVQHHQNWPQLKSMLFVEDRVHIKFIDVKELFTLWCQFSSLYNSQNCQAILLKAKIVKQSNRINTFDRLRFKIPLKYVLVESSLEEQTLALHSSIQNDKKRDFQRTESILSSDSQIEHEFIKQPVPLVTGPIQHINSEKVTPLDLDNFMCYCIFGFSLPDDYYDAASRAFATRYAKSIGVRENKN